MTSGKSAIENISPRSPLWISRDEAKRNYHCTDNDIKRLTENGDLREKVTENPQGERFSLLNSNDLNELLIKRNETIPHPSSSNKIARNSALATIAAAIGANAFSKEILSLKESFFAKGNYGNKRTFGRNHPEEKWRLERTAMQHDLLLSVSGLFLRDVWNMKNYEDFIVHFPEVELILNHKTIKIPCPEALIEIGAGIVHEFGLNTELFLSENVLSSIYYQDRIFMFKHYKCRMAPFLTNDDYEFLNKDPLAPLEKFGINIESFLLPIGASVAGIFDFDEYLSSIHNSRHQI